MSEQQYQWGTRITMEYLAYTDTTDESTVYVEDTVTENRMHSGEGEARARVRDFQYAQSLRAQGNGGRHPKHQRVSDMKLIRRPVGEWEEVQP